MLERSVFVNKSIRWVYEPGDIRHDTGGTFILRQWLWFLSDVYAHTIRHDNDSSQTDERKQQTCISLTVLYQPHRVLAASLPVPWAVKLKWSVTSRDGRMNGTNWSEWYSTTSSSWRHTHTSTNARTVWNPVHDVSYYLREFYLQKKTWKQENHCHLTSRPL